VARVAGIGTEEAQRRAVLVAHAPSLLKQLRMQVTQCRCGHHTDGIDFENTCPRCKTAVEVIEKVAR
jgi:predicted Zn-ribbon and HTH transcriptional regulator